MKTLAMNASPNLQVAVKEREGFRRGNEPLPEFEFHRREVLNAEAALAGVLIERWGPVMGEPDGETTTGHAKTRPCTPQEIVTRCCDTAALAHKEFARRGWIDVLPTYEEAQAILMAENKTSE